MKKLFNQNLVLALSIVLLTSCSPRQNLKTGTDYVHQEQGLFSSTVYVFSEQTVSVYKIVAPGQDVCAKSDGSIVTSDDTASNSYYYNALHGVGARAGTTLSKGEGDDNRLKVLFGAGDRMPIVESVSFAVTGTSVQIDLSQGHTKYFEIAHCNSGPEVFSIKNDGLVLESASTPGFILTMGSAAPTQQQLMEKAESDKYYEDLGKLKEDARKLRGN